MTKGIYTNCDGKVQHKTELAAQYYLDNINSSENAEIYKCKTCGFFHIGTFKNKKTKQKRVKFFENMKDVIKIRKMKL